MIKYEQKWKHNDSEIYNFYEHVLSYSQQNISSSKYCIANNLDQKEFSNILSRITNASIRNPILYEKLLEIGKEFYNSELSVNNFCVQNKLRHPVIKEFISHLNYIDVIKKECINYQLEYISCSEVATNPRLLRLKSYSKICIDDLYIPHIKDEGKESNVSMGFRHVKPIEEPMQILSSSRSELEFKSMGYEEEIHESMNEIMLLVSGLKIYLPENISDEKIIKLIKTMRKL